MRCSSGAPSLVNGMGAVGATDLLKPPAEVLELDMSIPPAQLAQQASIYGNWLHGDIMQLACLH